MIQGISHESISINNMTMKSLKQNMTTDTIRQCFLDGKKIVFSKETKGCFHTAFTVKFVTQCTCSKPYPKFLCCSANQNTLVLITSFNNQILPDVYNLLYRTQSFANLMKIMMTKNYFCFSNCQENLEKKYQSERL